ncbi:diguanylate cyclase (GGDEF) domain-containing protein [Amphritea atlantica]|uniref:diguanylate cyclase n=1 Tax=Amphritea atlantica TaxID=355243 RepID=A0A1H9DA01_9GAMM|nr:diguanylate cyclase [Amphritea atlantica]SEQ10305.1 diguanylate cyclase (GGDEF) domain-containing protein [Amphritea atlantica]
MSVLDDLLEKIDQQEFVRLSADIRTVFHQHLRWFNSLNLALVSQETVLKEEDYCCCSHSHCQFGQWIKRILDNPKFHHPFFLDLDIQHKNFHAVANQLLTGLQSQQPVNLLLYKALIEAQEAFTLEVLTLFEFSVVSTNQFDTVTGLMNRRSIYSVLNYEKNRMSRDSSRSCCIALVDIDHFKRVNDRYGHDAGDSALSQVAAVLLSFTRQSDSLARYGGEEFLFVLPDIEIAEAQTGIERVRRKLADTPIVTAQGNIQITASFGITQLSAQCDIENSIKRADEALYLAKNSGRNCSAYIDLDSFSAADRETANGQIDDHLHQLLARYSKRVNSEL